MGEVFSMNEWLRRYIAEQDQAYAESLMDENWGATVARIEPAKHGPGAPEGSRNNPAGRGGKMEETNAGNSDINQTKQADTRKRSNKDPERIIARLKRDAATDPQAQSLLEAVTNRSIRPYAAAKAMGWVKPMRSIPVDTPEAAIRALLRPWPWPPAAGSTIFEIADCPWADGPIGP